MSLQMTLDGKTERTYNRTHPWLRLHGSIDGTKISPHLWLMLGECNSKCEHLAKAPLRNDTANDLHVLYLAKGVLGTAAIEGNTLTEEEVIQRIEGTLRLPPSKQYLQQEIDNILNTCTGISDNAIKHGASKLTTQYLCEINKKILHNLNVDEGVVPGELRAYSVGVGTVYRAAPVEDLEFLLGALCEWLNSDEFAPAIKQYSAVYAIIKAIVAHLYMAWIHPFGDGNGRTARMLEFHILIESGLPTPVAHLLSNHYNLTRTEYYRQLDMASKSGGDVWPFVTYAVQGLLDGLKEQVERIWKQQYDVSWMDYIASRFRGDQSMTGKRRLHLIQGLSHCDEPVSLNQILDLNPQIAKDCAGKNSRTISRDLAALVEMGLAVVENRKYRAKKEFIQAFRPPRIN